MFEGYKVPECTEEEVRKSITNDECSISSNTVCRDACEHCVVAWIAREKGITQRYLDHRWPQKVIVHCPTQELWDRVQKRMYLVWSRWKYNPLYPCCAVNGEGHRESKESYEKKGYKIISAVEYLGEERIEGFKSYPVPLPTEEVSKLYLNNLTNTTEEDMNDVIAEVYKDKKYEEVVMVNKYFGDNAGNQVADNHFGKILLEAHKKEVFAKAVELKEEEEADKK